jgi:acyl-ACP thioesterase
VHPLTGRPVPLEDWFFDIYGESARGRRVSGRLVLPAPPAQAVRRPWSLRASDLDVLGHVNNAAHWEAVEEALIATPGRPIVAAELEHRATVDLNEDLELVTADDGDSLSIWLTCGAQVRTAARLEFGSRRDPQ